MKSKLTTLDLVHISLLVVLISVGGFIKIPFPLVPITLQFFFVNLGMLIFDRYKGGIAVAIYVFIGLIGIPVFSAGGGPQYVLHPTFGYLLGMIVGAFVSGYIKDKLINNLGNNAEKNRKLKVYVGASLINVIIVYVIGLPFMICIVKLYLGAPVPVSKLVMSGFLLTIPGDLIKIALGSFISTRIDKTML